METLYEDVLAIILGMVSNGADRKSCSEVCKLWYQLEALTRLCVRVQIPEQIPNFLLRFPNLTTFIAGSTISDETLDFLSKNFPKLQILNLNVDSSWASNPLIVDFGDEGLSALAAGCLELKEVALHCRRNIGYAGIVDLSLRNLTALDLSDCVGVTDESLEVVANMASLSRLNIRLCLEISDQGIEFLTNGPAAVSLRVFDMSFCHVTEVGVCSLKGLRFLEELSLCGVDMNDAAALAISSISNLRILDISYCLVTDIGVCSLRQLQFLEELMLSSTDMTNAGGLALLSISSLRMLDMSSQFNLMDSTLVDVASSCQHLAILKLSACISISDLGLEALSSGPTARSLRVLDISLCRQITDVGVSHLKRLSFLVELNLGGCGRRRLTDKAGLDVASIVTLQKLSLSKQDLFTDVTLFAIANHCRNLVEINLSRCEGKMNQGLLYLAHNLKLKMIWLPPLEYLGESFPVFLMSVAKLCPGAVVSVDPKVKRWFTTAELETLSGMCQLRWERK